MKKVLLAVPYHAAFKQPLINGFQKIDYDVLVVDYRFLKGNLKFNLESIPLGFHGIITLFINRFSQNKGHNYQSKILNQYIVKKAKEYKPDIFFAVKGENINAETLEKLKRQKVKTICWLVDYMFQDNVWPWFKKIGPHFNLVLQTETGIEDKVAKLNWKNKRGIMLHAADPMIKDLKLDTTKKYNVVFVGTYNPAREKLLVSLKKYGLKIWGYNWENSKLKDCYQGVLPYSKLLPTYAASKIVIANNQSVFTPFTNRIYEAASGKALVLLEYNKLISKVPNLGLHITCFKSAVELEKLVGYYLNHESQRSKKAEDLYKIILKYHLYDQRLKMVLDKYL